VPLFPRTLLPVFLLGLCGVIRPAAGAEWRLKYQVEQQTQSAAGPGQAAPRPKTRSFVRSLALGEGYLTIEDADTALRTVYDFRSRRIRVVQMDREIYDDWSLYGAVGGRISELLNRVMLADSLRAAKVPLAEGTFVRFDDETELSLELPAGQQAQAEPVIEKVGLPDHGWDFQHDGEEVVQFFPAAVELPPERYGDFVRFLAYGCSVHPEVRRQIAASGRIPEKMVLHWRQANTRLTATYRLLSAKKVDGDSSVLPREFRPADHPGDPLYRVLGLVGAGAGESLDERRDRRTKFVTAALADLRPLDALLALVEYGLETGDQPMEEFHRYAMEFQADDQCKRYLSALNQSSREACQNSLVACDSIDPSKLKKAYMLDLQRADLYAILGGGRVQTQGQIKQLKQAEELFLSVLTANPSLTGAYHDLGGLYFKEFDPTRAWLCFDAGRRLYPNHPLFQEITAWEQRYVRDFPDNF